MKFQIKHEIKGRMRLHIFQKKQMSCEQADILLYYLENIEGVESAKVYERTADAVVRYAADKDGFVRQNIIKEVQKFVYDKVEVPEENSKVGWLSPDEAVRSSTEAWMKPIYKKLNQKMRKYLG